MKKGGALPIRDIKNFLYKSYSKDKPSDYGEYQVDHSLSDRKAQVYHHPGTKQTVVVHRGTQDSRDVLNDAAYMHSGIKGDRFYHAKKIQQKAEKKYGAHTVSTIGHSLGSLLSSDVGKNSKEIINYNKPVDVRGRSNKNEYNISTSRDPFSFFVPRKTINIKSKTLNPVHEHSIDRLDDLDQDQMIGGAGCCARERGLCCYTVKELKQRIKEHNKMAKGDSKIKGYGYMKKRELKEMIHQIPGMMK
jgi:hypothetical protein